MLTWHISEAWFTRNTVYIAAPVGTVAEIRFTPDKKGWERLIRFFGDTPLISGRSLTLKDIQPITHGEFAVFIGEDGRTSLAIRTKDIPQKTFDSLGVVVQSPSKTVFLLSDRILPLHTENKAPGWLRQLIRREEGGMRIHNKETDTYAYYPINIRDEEIGIRLQNEKTVASPWKFIPDGTILALSTPEWTKEGVSPIVSQITQVWGERVNQVFSPFHQENSSKTPFFLWKGEGDRILLSGASSMGADTLQEALRVLAAASEPKTRDFTLPDTSTVKEWYADPSSISVETLTRSGVPVYRAVGDISTYFATMKDEKFVLTNSEDALASWLKEPSEKSYPSCSYALYFNLSSYASGGTESIHLPNLFEALTRELPHVRIEPGSDPWVIFSKEPCG